MSERTIASRPSMKQVMAMVEFMEEHPALGRGQLRGLEGRYQSKELWVELTQVVNKAEGPTRPMKSWMKYWADKKSSVRSKVMSNGGDADHLCSNIEKKIWDLFIINENEKTPKEVKKESHEIENVFFNEDSMELEHNDVDSGSVAEYEVPAVETGDRHMVLMEKLVKVMSNQAEAMTQMANASQANSQAIERLAEASHIQARALDRLANTFETINTASHDVRNAIVDIDASMKRFYSTSPT